MNSRSFLNPYVIKAACTTLRTYIGITPHKSYLLDHLGTTASLLLPCLPYSCLTKQNTEIKIHFRTQFTKADNKHAWTVAQTSLASIRMLPHAAAPKQTLLYMLTLVMIPGSFQGMNIWQSKPSPDFLDPQHQYRCSGVAEVRSAATDAW